MKFADHRRGTSGLLSAFAAMSFSFSASAQDPGETALPVPALEEASKVRLQELFPGGVKVENGKIFAIHTIQAGGSFSRGRSQTARILSSSPLPYAAASLDEVLNANEKKPAALRPGDKILIPLVYQEKEVTPNGKVLPKQPVRQVKRSDAGDVQITVMPGDGFATIVGAYNNEIRHEHPKPPYRLGKTNVQAIRKANPQLGKYLRVGEWVTVPGVYEAPYLPEHFKEIKRNKLPAIPTHSQAVELQLGESVSSLVRNYNDALIAAGRIRECLDVEQVMACTKYEYERARDSKWGVNREKWAQDTREPLKNITSHDDHVRIGAPWRIAVPVPRWIDFRNPVPGMERKKTAASNSQNEK